MKKCLKSVLFVFLFALALRAAPVCAEAAVFRSVPLSWSQANDEGQRDLEKLKIGNRYFWIRDYRLYYSASKKAKGQKLSNEIYGAVTDGNTIYFAKYSGSNNKAAVYSYTTKNKKKKFLGRVNAYNIDCRVIGCVGGRVYLTASGSSKVVRYDPKSKKVSEKTIEYRLDNGNSYGKFVTGWNMAYVGNNASLEELYLHDLITGKGIRIGEKGAGHNTYFTKNKLFYSQEYYKKDPSSQQLRYRGTKIFSYDLKTGKKKAVTKMLKIYTITKLTSSSVTFMQEGTGKIRTVRF